MPCCEVIGQRHGLNQHGCGGKSKYCYSSHGPNGAHGNCLLSAPYLCELLICLFIDSGELFFLDILLVSARFCCAAVFQSAFLGNFLDRFNSKG